jgi:hypothetical protein
MKRSLKGTSNKEEKKKGKLSKYSRHDWPAVVMEYSSEENAFKVGKFHALRTLRTARSKWRLQDPRVTSRNWSGALQHEDREGRRAVVLLGVALHTDEIEKITKSSVNTVSRLGSEPSTAVCL